MEHDEITAARLAGAISNVASTALSAPLIWPKSTALAVVVAAGLAAIFVLAPLARSREAPPPNAARIEQMLKAVHDADAAVRTRAPLLAEPDSDFRGVFETMRDRPQPQETMP